MKTYFIGLLTAITLLLAVASYSQETIKMATNDNSIQAGATNISGETAEYSNSDEPIKVNAGQRFNIRMQSNPTTGYGWRCSKADEKVVQFVTNVYIPPDSKLVGAGGYEVWTFKAVGTGTANISMKYVRPWEKDQPPARTNVYAVIVK